MQTETITLGGGCFWCLEAAFQLIRGVTAVTPGYAGGSVPNPTYEAICTGKTGHAQVVQVEFDPTVITFPEVLEVFWALHNPTTLNRQGADVGTEYRSIILYHTEEQRRQAEASKLEVAKLWDDPIVTEIVPLQRFYVAEEYHHNYFRRNPSRGYCQIVINPKLAQLRQKFAARLID